jgi:hypothetical protein
MIQILSASPVGPQNTNIQKLDNVTWFGHCVIHVASALRDLPTSEAKLLFIESMRKYMDRQERDISRRRSRSGE